MFMWLRDWFGCSSMIFWYNCTAPSYRMIRICYFVPLYLYSFITKCHKISTIFLSCLLPVNFQKTKQSPTSMYFDLFSCFCLWESIIKHGESLPGYHLSAKNQWGPYAEHKFLKNKLYRDTFTDPLKLKTLYYTIQGKLIDHAPSLHGQEENEIILKPVSLYKLENGKLKDKDLNSRYVLHPNYPNNAWIWMGFPTRIRIFTLEQNLSDPVVVGLHIQNILQTFQKNHFTCFQPPDDILATYLDTENPS